MQDWHIPLAVCGSPCGPFNLLVTVRFYAAIRARGWTALLRASLDPTAPPIAPRVVDFWFYRWSMTEQRLEWCMRPPAPAMRMPTWMFTRFFCGTEWQRVDPSSLRS